MGNNTKTNGWFERRLDGPYGTAVEKPCAVCGRPMWLPLSKIDFYHRCSPECSNTWRKMQRDKRHKECATCGAHFYPRLRQIRLGQGIFCSQRCNTKAKNAITDPINLAKAQERQRELRKAGLLKNPTGPDNKRWKGGPTACRERRRDNGKEAASQRAYAAANPEKRKMWTRENHARRREQKGGKLPYGTVPKIGLAQRWKCAACQCAIRKRYHIDHIVPLAKGGRHEPRNIQLLCATCNLRKGAKPPEEFMRQLGLLV